MWQMATLFLYGPYLSVSDSGLPPGAQEFWSFGPWPWGGTALIISANPLSFAGLDRTTAVTNITSNASPNGDRFVFCTVTNVGPDPVNYEVWLGGAS